MNVPLQACERVEAVSAYALGTLPTNEAASLDVHLRDCAACRRELESLRQVVEAFAGWPTDVLRPAPTLWDRLAARIAEENGGKSFLSPASEWPAPEWENVAPGISCRILATDRERQRVSMLVRLAPGAHYPAHTHAGVEELHLLAGELWIEDRKLYPGDYNRGEPGTSDQLVWSETGCCCVLIASPKDVLR